MRGDRDNDDDVGDSDDDDEDDMKPMSSDTKLFPLLIIVQQ